MKTLRFLAISFLALANSALAAQQAETRGLRFELSFNSGVRSGPTTGRMFVMISGNNEREPRLQVGRTGVPFYGVDIEQMSPGQVAIIDGTTLGSPVENINDIPPGDYYVQAMLNVYTRFERADGHVVWMHMDQWEGQRWRTSPGNAISDVVRLHLDPEQGGTIKLEVDQVIPPIPFPEDTEWVKRFRFQSELLSEFWGHPIYIGATVLLPRGYQDRPNVYFPVIYRQGHFSTRDPYPHGRGSPWQSAELPRMLAVTFQHPCPYFDDSYAVNSVNVGPYGDAIVKELIPEIERRFRAIPEPYARVLTGGSTGGWESVALQVWNPDFFGGAFAFAPDPVDFHNVEGINIYEDENAFYKTHEWRKVPIANTRRPENGEVVLTSRQRNYYELVNGTKGRSGEQLDIWSAVFGPLGDDGYFKPLFDKRTGEIDPVVAQYWRENFDIRYYLETNWDEVGPELVGKLHIYCGHMDNYYLNVGVYRLEEFLESTQNPYYAGSFTYGARGGHGWRPFSAEQLIHRMAEHITRNSPAGARSQTWKY